jgi:Glycosyltransferase family 87
MIAARALPWPRLVVAAGLCAIAIFFHLTWVAAVDVWRIDRDWRGFFHAGELFLAGNYGAIYEPRPEGVYPAAFVYPPPMLWPFMLLAWAGPPAGYGILTGGSMLLLALALRLLGDLFEAPRGAVALVALATLASAPWTTMLFVGQLSMVPTLLFVVGFVAWARGAEFAAGVAFGAMLCKPTLAFAAPLLALLTGRWRILLGTAVVAVALAVSSLPLGIDLWSEWFTATQQLSTRLRAHTLLWKHTTVYAFWRATVGQGEETALVRALWLAGSAALVLAASAIVLRRGTLPIPRLMTVAALLTVTVTPYLFYYDQLLLLPAGAAWYLGRRDYRLKVAWGTAGLALLSTCLAHHASVYFLQSGPPLAGLCNTVWFAAELWDLYEPVSSRA